MIGWHLFLTTFSTTLRGMNNVIFILIFNLVLNCPRWHLRKKFYFARWHQNCILFPSLSTPFLNYETPFLNSRTPFLKPFSHSWTPIWNPRSIAIIQSHCAVILFPRTTHTKPFRCSMKNCHCQTSKAAIKEPQPHSFAPTRASNDCRHLGRF